MKLRADVTNRLNNIAQTYEEVKTAINGRLSPKGYRLIDEKYNHESFGSRYVTWSDGTNGVRMIWDGKDEWFILEAAHRPPFDWRSDWKMLTYVPYLRDHDLVYASTIPNNIVSGLD